MTDSTTNPTQNNDLQPINGESMNLTDHAIEQLKELFPNVVSEGKVDFEALKSELGESLEESNERYQFTWAGKEQAKRIATTPTLGTLRPAPEESVNWDNTENLYIEGDNLEVLKLLQKSYFGKVKMIYIDPPYNTGKDFVYKDDFKDNLANYQRLTGQKDEEGNPLTTNSDSAGRYHSNWLNMMYPRLKLARNLMRDDGVIFISIDDHEIHNLRKVCDEIFGVDNFIENFIWKSGRTASSIYTREHEYILAYGKKTSEIPLIQYQGEDSYISDRAIKKVSIKNPATEIHLPAGIRFEGENKTFPKEFGSSEKVEITNGLLICKDGKLEQPVTIKAGWAMKDMIEKWISGEDVIDSKGQKIEEFFFKSNGILQYSKRRGTEHPKTIITNTTTKEGSNLLSKTLDFSPFDYPKSTTLIHYFCGILQHSDTVLDFFSGSATTAHAIMQLNAANEANHKFILVQIPEHTPDNSEASKAGYETIAEIGKERIRRAAQKIKEEHPDTTADLGFKVLKLDTSNIKKWQPNLDTLEADLLAAVDNIVDGRIAEDLLYEVLIKYGLPLTLPIEKIQVANHQAYNVAFGSLVACFDENITLDTVQAICDLSTPETPILRVVFRDTSFDNDITKTNAIQRLKQAGIEDVLSI